MIVPEFRELRVDHVKPAPYNPESRTTKKNMRHIVRMMAKYGMPYPILVTLDRVVIDGHRRLQAAKELEWTTIQCIVLAVDSKSIYAALNSATRKMTGNEFLVVWLREPEAVIPETAKNFEEMQEMLGKRLVQKIASRGMSIGVYRVAKEIHRYCGADIPQTVEWILENGPISLVRVAMRNEISPSSLLRCIADNKGISLKYTA